MRRNTQAEYWELPDIPNGPYSLPPSISIVVPVSWDVENLIENPSFEHPTLPTEYWQSSGCANINADKTQQFSGTWSLIAECGSPSPPMSVFYGFLNPLSTTSGTTYVASIWFLGSDPGKEYQFYIATTAGVRVNGISFRSTGFWQRVWFSFKETSTTSRRLYIISENHASTFWLDAAQFEVVPSGQIALPTTYIDGDLTPANPSNSVVYYWNGNRYISTSTRVGGTRSGGRVINLSELGLTISVIGGLGMITPNSITLPFGQLDGELYQRTSKNPRLFSIAGRVTARSPFRLSKQMSSISSILDVDISADRDPMILKHQPMDETGEHIGSEVNATCTYEGGLEGTSNNFNTDTFSASFRQYSPALVSHDSGDSFATTYTELTNVSYIIRRKADGTWSNVDAGVSGGTPEVKAIAEHPDGTIYIGGNFTDAGGSGANYAAIYDPVTDFFSSVVSATTFNGEVNAIVIDKGSGIVYFGGAFTNANGIPNADGIVSYDPSSGTFSALGTGVSVGTAVMSLELSKDGTLYAGGSFALMGGVANTLRIARWDGSVWTPMGTGANGNVLAIAAVGNGIVYIGGEFTLAGGVANTIRIATWNGAAWVAMGTGANNTVRDLMITRNGLLYVAGSFTTLNGLSIGNFATWNGTSFIAVGPILNNQPVHNMAIDRTGSIYIVGGLTNLGGNVYDQGIARWDGTFTPIDVLLPAVGVTRVMIDRRGDIYFAFSGTGTAIVPGTITLNNRGTARSYPTVKIVSTTAGARVYQIINITSKKSIFMRYRLFEEETVTLNFDPQIGSFESDVQGNITSSIFLGSDDGNFFLVPGDNIVKVLVNDSVINASFIWPTSFLSADDAVGVI